MRKFYYIFFILLLILTACSQTPKKEETAPQQEVNLLEVHFIDVGQGDSIYIKTPDGETILIDAAKETKAETIISYLKEQQVSEIDYLISTHPDADHIGGMDKVIESFPIHHVYAPKVSHTTNQYKQFLEAVQKRGLKITVAAKGVTLPITDVNAEFIAPVGEYGKDLNNWSAVLKVTYGKSAFLFTGDAEFRSEKDMIASGEDLHATVLKLGHHGAKEASSQEFIDAVNPEIAVISAGLNNSYGHPTSETLVRLGNRKIYRTDEDGTIVIAANKDKIVGVSLANEPLKE